VERGFIGRGEAVPTVYLRPEVSLTARRGPEPDASGYKAFYYHFLDMSVAGARLRNRSSRPWIPACVGGCVVGGLTLITASGRSRIAAARRRALPSGWVALGAELEIMPVARLAARVGGSWPPIGKVTTRRSSCMCWRLGFTLGPLPAECYRCVGGSRTVEEVYDYEHFFAARSSSTSIRTCFWICAAYRTRNRPLRHRLL
jgi:hypothetical protein